MIGRDERNSDDGITLLLYSKFSGVNETIGGIPPKPYTSPVPPAAHILATPSARTLAIDVGDRRIGLAITDALGLTAQPLFTIHRAAPRPNLRADIQAIARFVRQHHVETVIVGNPLHADGTTSPQSLKTLAFADALLEHLKPRHPNLTLHLLDERLTTREAHTLLSQSKKPEHSSPRSSKAGRLDHQQQVDQVAAVLLLEAFLSRDSVTLLPDPDPDPEA